LFALLPASAAAQVPIDPNADTAPPSIVIFTGPVTQEEPGDKTYTSPTAPQLEQVKISYCDAHSPGLVTAMFGGQTYSTSRDLQAGASNCAQVGAVFRVTIPAAMMLGANVLSVRGCDMRGNCRTTSVTYTWQTVAPPPPPPVNAAPEITMNAGGLAPTYGDSVYELRITWRDDVALNPGSRSVSVNGVPQTGLTFTPIGSKWAESVGPIRLTQRINTVTASISDSAGLSSTKTGEVRWNREGPTIAFWPDSLRTSDSIPDLQVIFEDDWGMSGEYPRKMQLNGIDVTARFSLSATASTDLKDVWQAHLALQPGSNTLTATVCEAPDFRCRTASTRHLFRTMGTRLPPVVSLAPTATDRRIPSPFEGSYTHSTPAYVSDGEPRSVSLVYLSGQAAPRATVEVDATDLSAQPPSALSIQVYSPQGAAETSEIFYAGGSGTTRLVASWDETSPGVSAKLHNVIVRSYWPDGTSIAAPAMARIVVVNEQNSAFGRGWSLAGVQRLHIQDATTLVLTEGDGSAAVFSNRSCVTTSFTYCPYTSPAGDFTTLAHYPGSGYYARQYPDASYVKWNDLGMMIEAGDRFGNKTYFRGWRSVNGRMQLDSIVDPAGRVTRLTYHGGSDQNAGKLASVIDPGGRTSQFFYGANNNLTSLVDPDGAVVTLGYTGTTSGLLSSASLRGGGSVTDYQYDHARLLSALVAPAIRSGPGGQLERPTVAMVSAVSRVLPSAATSLGAPRARTDAERAWNVIRPVAGDSAVFTLDRWRGVANARDADGRITRLVRNAAGLDSLRISSDADTVAYLWSGRLLTAVTMGRADTLTRYTYVTPVWPVTVPNEIWSGGKVVTRYFWNSRALLDSVSEGGKTRFTYDALGRTASVTENGGRLTSFTYQPSGFRNVATATTDGRQTQFTYDAFGRTTSATDALGGADTLTYDLVNRAIVAADGLGNRTRFRYGPAFLDSIIDANNQQYRYARNQLGGDTLFTAARGGATRTWYNRAGQPDSVLDRRGQMVRFTYQKGQLTERRAGTDVTTFRYDTAGTFVVVQNAVSTDTLYSELPGTLTHGETTVRGGRRYGVQWRETRQKMVTHQPGFPLSPIVGDRLRSAMLSSPFETTRFVVREEYFGPYIWRTGDSISFSLDARSRIRKLSYPTGDTVSFEYTSQDGIARVAYNRPALEQNLGVLYRRDALGRVIRRIDARLDSAWVYRYDGAGRLARFGAYDPGTCALSGGEGYDCSVQAIDTTTWTIHAYDGVGNRTDQGAVVQAGNRTTRFGPYTMVYDSAGFMVRKYLTSNPANSRSFEWNALGQLTSVTTNGSVVRYEYDGLGRRVRRTAGSDVAEYVYSGDHIMAELDGSGAVRATFAYAPGVDLPLTMRRDGKTYFYHRDHHGSITALTDSAGAIVNRYRYDAWGNTAVMANAVSNPFAFAGREFDPATGLYFNRARYYDPQLGRFISEDPIGLAGGVSLYGYAASDPVNLSDPSGLSPYAAGAAVEDTVPVNNRDAMDRRIIEHCEKKGGGEATVDRCINYWSTIPLEGLNVIGDPRVIWVGVGSGRPGNSFAEQAACGGAPRGGQWASQGCVDVRARWQDVASQNMRRFRQMNYEQCMEDYPKTTNDTELAIRRALMWGGGGGAVMAGRGAYTDHMAIGRAEAGLRSASTATSSVWTRTAGIPYTTAEVNAMQSTTAKAVAENTASRGAYLRHVVVAAGAYLAAKFRPNAQCAMEAGLLPFTR
jgi:RHS repeat-associated protein